MHMMLEEERCPVAEDVLGALYAAGPEALAVLIQAVPPQSRAELALYFSRRAHFGPIGRAIASQCGAGELERMAGKRGARLFEEAHGAFEEVAVARRTRRPVSLSRGMLRNVIIDMTHPDVWGAARQGRPRQRCTVRVHS